MMEEKYEFNAPKFFDFEKPDDSGNCDHWFDERDGDEGGISLEMVPLFENVGSFSQATNAISGALESDKLCDDKSKENEIPNEYVPATDASGEQLNITLEQIRINVENNLTSPKSKSIIMREPLRDKGVTNGRAVHGEKLNIDNNESTNNKSEKYTYKHMQCNELVQCSDFEARVSNETTVCYLSRDGGSQSEETIDEPEDDTLQGKTDRVKQKTTPEHETRQKMPTRGTRRKTWNTPKTPKTLASFRETTEETEDNKLPDKSDGVKFRTTPEPLAHHRMPTRASVAQARNTPKTPKTPKSRFQPVRKSTAKPLDYGNKKRKYTPRKFVLDEPEYKKSRRTEEERNLEKMKKLQEKTKRHRLVNERSMAKALKGRSCEPLRSVNVTQTKEFAFVMANRSREHSMATRASTPFEKKLRQESIVHNYKNEPTQPVPFNFVLPEKIKSTQLNNYVSMAEATQNFLLKKSPSRLCKKTDENRGFVKPHITRPITPNLLTRKRARAPHVESAQQIEDKLVKEMKTYQFKAKEVNPKILEMKGLYGVKSVQPVSNTEQQPFNFRIEERISQRKPQEVEAKNEAGNEEIKKSAKLKPTIPQPFSFEDRDKGRLSKKEHKIQRIEEEERRAREFHARGLPSFSPHQLPDIQTKDPTEIVAFKVSERSEVYKEQYELKLRAGEEEENRKRQFYATKCEVTVREPFQPIKGLIPPTNIDNVRLHTEDRAQKRSEFDEYLQRKEKEKDEAKARLEKERQEEEEKEVKQLRKEIVHKANPIRSFKPMEVKKSTVTLTEPMTPNLRVKARANVRETK